MLDYDVGSVGVTAITLAFTRITCYAVYVGAVCVMIALFDGVCVVIVVDVDWVCWFY